MESARISLGKTSSNTRIHLRWNVAHRSTEPISPCYHIPQYCVWVVGSLHHLETGGRSKALRAPSGQLLLAEDPPKSKNTTFSPELPMKSPEAVMRFTSPRRASSMS